MSAPPAIPDMSAAEYEAAIAALGLNQVQAAYWLNVSTRQSQRYARGAQTIPPPVAMLLRLAIHLKLEPAEITKIAAKRAKA